MIRRGSAGTAPGQGDIMQHKKLLTAIVFLFLIVGLAPAVEAQEVSVTAPAEAGINEAIEITVSGPPAKGDMLRFADESGKLLKGAYVYVGNLKNNKGALSAPLEPGTYQVAYVSGGKIVASSPLTVTAVTATLKVPESADINETIEVQFDGPMNKGDYVQMLQSDETPIRGFYAYVGNAKNGIVKLRVPAEGGDYGVGYFTGKTLIGSSPMTVRGVTATVTAPESVSANETFELSFDGPLNNGDYLQFVDANGKPMSGLYRYAGQAKDNVTTLTAPVEPGSYSIAYFTAKKPIGSTPITVTGTNATLTMEGTVPAGAHFPVGWQGPNNSGDMIRVLRPDGANAGSYAYVGHNPETVTLRAPEEIGDYRVAYLSGGQILGETAFTVAEVSAKLDAPAEVEGNQRFNVTWQGPGNYGDLLQLVDPAKPGNLAYSYVDKKKGNVTAVHAPNLPGTYELRYLTHGGKVLAAAPVTIIPAKLEPGALMVEAADKPRLGPEDAIEVVLDASGSMLQRQGKDRRIEIAKRTLTSLISDTIPENTAFVLRVFGHKEADKCRTDLEIPLAPLDRAAANAVISGVTAMNLAKTPIADSLRETGSDLAAVTGERIIVLITDGEETCEGDPAAVIAEMRASGDDVRVNIVGYAIDDAALQETFALWANLGGGEYFNASDESALAEALTKAVNPSFTVTDEAGVTVAAGIAGGAPITLAAGNYSVTTGAGAQQITIEPAKLSTVRIE